MYYTSGSIALIWLILWAVLAFDTPQDDPKISEVHLMFNAST